MHAPGGIRTLKSRKRATTNPHLRRLSQRDRHIHPIGETIYGKIWLGETGANPWIRELRGVDVAVLVTRWPIREHHMLWAVASNKFNDVQSKENILTRMYEIVSQNRGPDEGPNLQKCYAVSTVELLQMCRTIVMPPFEASLNVFPCVNGK
jgi:hypothetical protein